MKPVREKRVVHIEITNACTNECVNCSRFVGHHKKTYFMDLKMVEQALLSVKDFPGCVGIMGGEPTLHPQFVEICDLMRKHISPEKRGLMTAGHNWEKYQKLIKRTFGEHVGYNDHNDVTQKHHPLLLSVNENAQQPDKWKGKCWVDDRWSASINPKGCFFCEVAAAMDLLFNGPGGLPIEKGWWNEGVEAFSAQQELFCNQCGAMVPYLPVQLQDDRDLVSESNYQRLLQVDSPRLRKGKVNIVREKYSDEDLLAMQNGWVPWRHFGVKEKEGTGKKNQTELYGHLYGWLLKMKIWIRSNCWTFAKLEVQTSKCLWKLGLR